MTATDLRTSHSGYWPSPWPVECGGNRRQKHAAGRLDAATSTAEVTSSSNGRWNVMVVRRDANEWFAAGTMAAFEGDRPFGWVQRIDPNTLEAIADTGPLPCGDHVWCGAVAAHANGSLYNVNGSFLHRVSTDCEVTAERELPVDQAHNGLLVMSDGSIVTKDLRLENGGPSTLTRLDPERLELVHDPVQLPEPSMGRIASDVTHQGEAIYIPGTTRVFRLWVEADGLRLDHDWQPVYRTDPSQGLAWDSCLSGGSAWIMDNGDIEGVRTIFDHHPNGRLTEPNRGRLSWQNPAPWPGPQRLLKVDLESGQVGEAAPLDTPGGGIIAPPVHVPSLNTVVYWDSINGGIAGLDDATLELKWSAGIRPTMQPVVYEESGELVINDFTADRHDDVVVLDLASGYVVSRVDVGSPLANGMFLSPGPDRSVFYCSTLTMAKISWH